MSAENNTNFSVNYAILETINNKYITYQLPAIVFTSLMMLLGLPGNMIVFYIYFFRWRRSTSRMFILFLAALDMANCAINLPMEIYIMRFSVMFEHPYLCKVSRFLSYQMNSSSALILLAISADRFRRICRPYQRSFSDRDSKYTCIGAVLFSILTTWPAFVLYGVRTIRIGPIVGQTCLLENKFDSTKYPAAYIVFMCVMTFLIFTILAVLYYFVGIQIYKHRMFKLRKCTHVEKFQEQTLTDEMVNGPLINLNKPANCTNDKRKECDGYTENKQSKPDVVSPETAIVVKNIEMSSSQCLDNIPECVHDSCDYEEVTKVVPTADHSTSGQPSVDPKNIQIDNNVPNDSNSSNKSPSSKQANNKIKPQRKRRVRYLLVRNSSTIHRARASTKCSNCITVNVGRSTYMLFLITIAYVICFLPFYTTLIIRLFDETFLSRVLSSEGAYMAYFLIVRSYLLSSAINPIIYSFCNAQFRQYCVETFSNLINRKESLYYQRSKR